MAWLKTIIVTACDRTRVVPICCRFAQGIKGNGMHLPLQVDTLDIHWLIHSEIVLYESLGISYDSTKIVPVFSYITQGSCIKDEVWNFQVTAVNIIRLIHVYTA